MSQVDDWSDGYTSDYLRDRNTYGPASANVPRSSVVSHQVRYRAPDTSDIPLAPGQNPEDSVYSNASGARMGQTKPASGYRAPAGGGWDVNSSDTNLRFSDESGGRRYARSKTKASAKPARKRTQKSAVPSGDDVTSTVVQAVRADGNTSFANWRQSLKNEGWTEEQAKAIVYDPSSGKFINTAKSPSSGGALTPDEQAMAERAASHRAETPAAETEGSTRPAPAKTEGSTQPTPADDHEQEVKAAVDEFLKQHPEDGKERLKSIYGAVDSQNIKDDAAYNLAVLAEIQKEKAQAAAEAAEQR